MKRKIFYLIFLLTVILGGSIFALWTRSRKEDEKGAKLLEIQEVQEEKITEGKAGEEKSQAFKDSPKPGFEESPAGEFVAWESPGEEKILPAPPQVFQTFNNCGPATLSMILGYWGISKSQKEIGDYLRPIQHPKGKDDDKTVFPHEFAEYVRKFGLESRLGVAGTTDLIETFLANDIPVVVKQWLRPDEDIGHFRIVRGFKGGTFITSCSYFGGGNFSYSRFMRLWQPFNYGYILVFPDDRGDLVDAILAQELSLAGEEKSAEERGPGSEDPGLAKEKSQAFKKFPKPGFGELASPSMQKKAVERAQLEIEADPQSAYSYFNLGTSLYHLGKYEEAKEAFEKADALGLPRRMLWYQIEPILTYNALGEYDQVFSWTERVFASGNPAFSELYYERGKAYLAMGQEGNAKREFELAVRYNLNFALAREALDQF